MAFVPYVPDALFNVFMIVEQLIQKIFTLNDFELKIFPRFFVESSDVEDLPRISSETTNTNGPVRDCDKVSV